MKALLAADLHYSLPQLDWLRKRAGEYDVLVLAGDFLDLSGAVDLETQIVVMEKTLRRLQPGRGLILCSGNHDLEVDEVSGDRAAGWLQNLRDDRCWVDGDSLMIADYMISVFPWWEGDAARAEVFSQLERDAEAPKKGWIWIYHAPPFGSSVAWTGRLDAGDASSAEWINLFQPDLVLSGHVHNAPFVAGGGWQTKIGKTVVVNGGRQLGAWPTHVLLDLEARTARWFSLENEGTVEW
jgi:Icc-related predicted phosphoesterase